MSEAGAPPHPSDRSWQQPFQHLAISADGPVVTVTLNRPDVRNAFNAVLIAEIDRCFRALATDPTVRVVILTGAGRAFSAGADLTWMQAAAHATAAENRADALTLARMLEAIDTCPKPVVVRVNGPALGGGAGLVAVGDLAVAVEQARIGFTEVRLGLVPATIAPYVIRKIGPGHARALFLLGEPLSAADALRVGLVHRVVPADELDVATGQVVQALLAGGPAAQAVCKTLVREVTRRLDDVATYTADVIATRRVSAEGQEGIRAFLERRPPAWQPDQEHHA